MALLAGYNENEVEVNSFDDLPAGDYKVEIIDSELKTSKSGSEYISLDMKVTAGECEGRHYFENLNIGHDNPKVVEIAHATVKKISLACGATNVKDSSDLHNKPFLLSLYVKKTGKYAGEIGANFKKLPANFSPNASVAAAPAAAPAATGEKAPWE